jgi:ERCC4-type nuclease
MIYVDTRAGSADLIHPLRTAGLEVEAANLPYGDLQIIGRGPNGRPVLVGVEYKKWADLLACMRSGRFAAQARGMAQSYEFSWLLVEGRVRPGKKGIVEEASWRGTWTEMHGRYTYQEVAAYVTTMAAKAGFQVWRTESLLETIAWIRGFYLWWTAKDWEDHRAHLQFYRAPVSEQFVEPSVVQLMAMALPGIGESKAAAVAETFSSPRAMCNAVEAQWMKVEGIGKTLAKRLVALCHGSSV